MLASTTKRDGRRHRKAIRSERGLELPFQRQVEIANVLVGVNQNVQEGATNIPTLRIDQEVQRVQCANLAKVKASRDAGKLHAALAAVRAAARGGTNLMPPIIESAKAYATEQEICDVLREELGTYTDPAEF